MNKGNPFDDKYIDDDKTILRPKPGGRSSNDQTKIRSPLSSSYENTPNQSNFRVFDSNLNTNPITSAAISLLSLIAQLRCTINHADVPSLRLRIVDEIKQFDLKLKNQQVPSEEIQASRYCLCAFLDETVLNTPWGNSSIWPNKSLLIEFYQEAFGGEKFFIILKNCQQQPGKHLDLLEFLYFCLSLGFQGRYRIEDHGVNKLEEIRENTFQIIQRQRGDIEHSLSLHWAGIKDKRNVLNQLIPLWVIGAIAAAVLLMTFLAFLYTINLSADPVLARLYLLKDSFNVPLPVGTQITPEFISTDSVQVNNQPIKPDLYEELSDFLASEVKSGDVALLKRNDKVVIRILSQGFFASGSDKISTQYYPLLDKISEALSSKSERITIVGHTDSNAIFSAKFPSNWDLSKARALSVTEILTNNNKLKATIVSEGRADTQPMVPNDSSEHKAMNRRVEIII
jgi:type VI secretion system protein ImpK